MTNNQIDLSKMMAAANAITAIGISGSHARGQTDHLSDVDLCVFVAGEIPSSDERKRTYAEIGFSDAIYFDVDFETSRGDGYWREGVRYDFNWMSIGNINSFLKKLEADFDSPEYVPGGLSIVRPLLDPNGIISKLQAGIPVYTDERAKHRIQQNIVSIHYSIYGLGWLEKAAYRQDPYLFLKHKNTSLEALFRTLYALNKTWFSEEKELIRKIAGFQHTPPKFEKRVTSIIMHQGGNADLEKCLFNLKKLFADTVRLAKKEYPDLTLPLNWE